MKKARRGYLSMISAYLGMSGFKFPEIPGFSLCLREIPGNIEKEVQYQSTKKFFC